MQRRPARLAGQVRETAHRLENARKPGALRVRAGLSEAGQAQHH